VDTAPSDTTLESTVHADRYRPRPHVVWTTHTDATVLLDADRGLYYTLNDVAGRTWELLAAGEPVLAILQTLGDEYEVEREVLEADLAALLRRLVEAGLVERVAP
jgi:Coenzyme PQQ synthesis protein D (PqqD)